MRYYGATPEQVYAGGYAGLGKSYVGATPAPYFRGGMAALGVIVPTPLPGQTDYAPDMKETGYNYCGSKFGFQQMLKDLGFYGGSIDGQIGTGTLNAAIAFGKQYGVPISGSLTNTFCAKLIQVWSATFAQAPVTTTASQPTTTTTTTTTTQDVPPPPEGRPTNGQPPPPRPGVTATPGASSASPLDKAKTWWDSQSNGTKTAMAVGGLAVVGLIGFAIMRSGTKKRSYKPNRATRRVSKRLTPAQKASIGRIRGKRAKAPTGKITTLKSGKRYGHLKPPKKYWEQGAKRPTDYADPEHYKYPLVFRNADGSVNRKRSKAHVRAAQAYFARNKRRYPMATRRKIARNINRAKERFDIGGKKVKP